MKEIQFCNLMNIMIKKSINSITILPRRKILEQDIFDFYFSNEVLHDQFNREYNEIDISVCLLLLKTKHNLTYECLNDIRKLLISLKVNNVPLSMYRVRKLIHTTSKSTAGNTLSTSKTTPTIICQKCERVSLSREHCSHTDCSNHNKYEVKPYTYIYFNIHHQFQQILYREERISCFRVQNEQPINNMRDVYDGQVYHRLLREVNTNEINIIMTLIMNVDGVAIGNNTEESLWIITCTINEIKRQERFKIHNSVICGICSCYKKPTRTIMQLLLKPIVEQLIQLEKPHLFQMKAFDNNYKLVQLYLIGACNDKPATSLVQNSPEPIGKYGCSRCELPGISVDTFNKGFISLHLDSFR